MNGFTHAAAGVFAATSVMALARRPRPFLAVLVGGLGGVLPDLDAIPGFPGFDRTVGAWLGLPSGASIYSGGAWYSHRHFTHSLAAALLATGVLALVWLVLSRPRRLAPDTERRDRVEPLALLGFALAWVLHLVGDMVTPGGSWGGVQLLWPHPVMVGGWGLTWWWNNYDVLLLFGVGGAVNLGLILGRRWVPRRVVRPSAAAVGALVVALVAVQLRGRSYEIEGDHWEMEARTHQEQIRILGPRLGHTLVQVDQRIPMPL